MTSGTGEDRDEFFANFLRQLFQVGNRYLSHLLGRVDGIDYAGWSLGGCG